ncbi:MAG: PEP-CTERM sorting domain-containing protein [Terrimicrobiaceae bacterium]
MSFLDAGATGTFNYGTGELTLLTVPEPATWLLIALSGTFLVVMRRRRAN